MIRDIITIPFNYHLLILDPFDYRYLSPLGHYTFFYDQLAVYFHFSILQFLKQNLSLLSNSSQSTDLQRHLPSLQSQSHLQVLSHTHFSYHFSLLLLPQES